MTIWRITAPVDTDFAEAALRSPAVMRGDPSCRRCMSGATYVLPRPLVFEWEPDSDQIGDFVWAAGRPAVRATVFDLLSARFTGLAPGEIEMVQDPRLKRPARITKRTRRRVWLPYDGPRLCELWTTTYVDADERTTFVRRRACSECGRDLYRIAGTGVKQHRYDAAAGGLVHNDEERVDGEGLFVRASSLGDAGFFRLVSGDRTGSGPLYCTDDAKRFIEESGLTNIDFWEVGDVV